ncbi:MAG: adenylosuccinate synthase, partial [Actinomycetota bacterium]|nr:adenylosuccinate synthase [Actinomycetota bacterium]
VVVNPKVLLEEMESLQKRGISCENLKISCNSHLVMPYHLTFDHLGELSLGKAKLGTTHRGIGPAYADKADRLGLRMQDLLDEKIFREKLDAALQRKNAILSKAFGQKPYSVDEIVKEYMAYGKKLTPHIVDASLLLSQAFHDGKRVLFEGAQGTLLDLDHGTYPFVTSSSPTIGGVFTGTGVGPQHVDKIIGVTKAYLTRVGYGPFPTEQNNEVGEMIGERGQEIGTTTGRKRRCGWLDGVLLRYATRINGINSIALTKLDVLSEFDTIKFCVGYSYGGKVYEEFPPHQSVFHKCEPRYVEVPGWKVDISGAREREDLPPQAIEYVELIEEFAGAPVDMVSVGPKRTQTILMAEWLKSLRIQEGPYLHLEDFTGP